MIAVAGDTVNIQGGEVYVNGEKVEIKDAIGATEVERMERSPIR